MFIAPAEVQDRKLKRRLRGYSRESVEKLLHEVVASYQQVWRERDHLQARVERLEKELAPLREAEDRLRDVLVTAERAASEVRAQAKIDADALLEQAKAKTKAQERAASEVRAQAEVDALALLEQAKAKSKASQSAMKAQQTRLKNEIERLKEVEAELHDKLRSFLRSGLQLIDDPNPTQPTPVAATPPSTQETPAPTTERSPVTQKTPA
jgi:cell division initiation protein